jgi:hypothetical protein
LPDRVLDDVFLIAGVDGEPLSGQSIEADAAAFDFNNKKTPVRMAYKEVCFSVSSLILLSTEYPADRIVNFKCISELIAKGSI